MHAVPTPLPNFSDSNIKLVPLARTHGIDLFPRPTSRSEVGSMRGSTDPAADSIPGRGLHPCHLPQRSPRPGRTTTPMPAQEMTQRQTLTASTCTPGRPRIASTAAMSKAAATATPT